MNCLKRYPMILMLAVLAIGNSASFGDVCVHVPSKPVRHVCGIVVDAEGRPIPAASLSLEKNQSVVASIVSAEDGSFNLESVLAGNYLLGISGSGFMPDSYQISVAKPISVCKRYLRIQLAVGAFPCYQLREMKKPKLAKK